MHNVSNHTHTWNNRTENDIQILKEKQDLWNMFFFLVFKAKGSGKCNTISRYDFDTANLLIYLNELMTCNV